MNTASLTRLSRGMSLAALLATTACRTPVRESVYTNPVWDGYLADPAVLEWQGGWYAYGTGRDKESGRQFPILHSKDFLNWTHVGYALDAKEGAVFKEYWAPEVVERDGTFYLYYAGNRRMRVAKSDSPLGPFKDCGVSLFPQWEFSIDGHPFRDPDTGEWYLFFARDFLDVDRVGTGLAVVRLGDDMVSVEGPVETVLTAFADWQVYERNRTMYGQVYDWHTVEGPWVVKRGGQFVLFYAASNWQTANYGVGFATADHPLGPWKDGGNTDGPKVLCGNGTDLTGPGHNSVVQHAVGDTDFIVYHSWDAAKTKRVMCIDPLEWTADGPRAVNPSFGEKSVKH